MSQIGCFTGGARSGKSRRADHGEGALESRALAALLDPA